jgi:hypothetical protein
MLRVRLQNHELLVLRLFSKVHHTNSWTISSNRLILFTHSPPLLTHDQPLAAMIQDGYPSPVYLEPTAEHKATVVIVHGMGDSGEAWRNHVKGWDWPNRFPHVRFVFPNAPTRDLSLVRCGQTMTV